MISTRYVAYGLLGVAALVLAVVFMGVFAWPLPIALVAAAVLVSPAVVLIRFGGWMKSVVEHAVGMR